MGPRFDYLSGSRQRSLPFNISHPHRNSSLPTTSPPDRRKPPKQNRPFCFGRWVWRPHASRQLFDLFRIPILGRCLRSKAFRRGMQVIMLLLAMAVLLDGFLGPQLSPMNLAGVLPWTHWRGFTVIALLFAGNLFCMVCPFMLVRDFGRRWLPQSGHGLARCGTNGWRHCCSPSYFWAYEAFSLWNSPWLTAWIILSYFLAASLIDGLFQGGSFCKYVCPIGQFHFVQSLLSPLEVKVRKPDVCRSCKTFDCIRGRSGAAGL